MQKFLFIKPAYISDENIRINTQSDILSLEQTLIKIYKDIDIDICSVTIDDEWLINGRKIIPEFKLKNYERVFVFVHNLDKIIDNIKHDIKHFADKYTFLYKAEDEIFHNAKRLAELIKINNIDNFNIKFPQQIHVDIKEHNDNAVTTGEIVSKYMRHLFLPVHTIETKHSKHKNHKNINLSYNAKEFAENIDNLRHHYDELTFREYINGQHIYIAVIPDFNNQEFYTSLPLIEKNINGIEMFDVANLSENEKKEVNNTAINISKISFTSQSVVYKLSVHARRGVFVQHSSSLLTYLLYYPDFIFEVVGSLGLDIEKFVHKIFSEK